MSNIHLVSLRKMCLLRLFPHQWGNGNDLKQGLVPIVIMAKMPGDTIANKPFTYIGKMFPYSYIKCPCGPPNVLEATWTPEEVYNPYSSTGNTICDKALLVLEVLHTVHLLHGKKPFRFPNMLVFRRGSIALGTNASFRI